VAGKPELGYAVGLTRPGTGGGAVIGAGAVLRCGAIVYADVQIAVNTVIGHHTLLRTGVRVGTETQLGHHLTVERATRIGRDVRCSPGCHITSSTILADWVFLGAGVRTINDKALTWKDPHRKPTLVPPRFDTGAKLGSGSVVLAGVTIGEHALIGAGSVVTHDIPPGALAYATRHACTGGPGDRRHDRHSDHDVAAPRPGCPRLRRPGRLAAPAHPRRRAGHGAHHLSPRRGPPGRA
jgi:acetyltransferase-like isoleucine patch superfamily enzyme